MARPRKCRRVCFMPVASEFTPNKARHQEQIILTVDEFETIRLIDKEGLSQEDCARFMDVARTTVQQIYTDARRKIALALVEGISLKIEGGHYKLCDGNAVESCCKGCLKRKKCLEKRMEENKSQQ